MKRHAMDLTRNSYSNSTIVILKWSEVLESAFDYYYADYVPAWTLSETPFNNMGDKLFISKKNQEWVSWEKIDPSDRPDVATLFDLLPDLPKDDEYWKTVREVKNSGIEDPEDYFWENIFSYRQSSELKVNGRNYKIEWEA
ncbi:MAG: hypothetical protein ACRENF_00875 [Thermodesulfobacteriota bacterium]